MFLSDLKCNGSCTLVGLHIRRGDMAAQWSQTFFHVAPAEYFEQALKLYRERYNNTIFVVVCEPADLDCVLAQSCFAAGDVHVNTRARTAGQDLAILAACNHTIMSVGTFGWWGAYLAGGDVTYYRPDFSGRPLACETDYYPSRWTCVLNCNRKNQLETDKFSNSVLKGG